jgi:hypothetical protein
MRFAQPIRGIVHLARRHLEGPGIDNIYSIENKWLKSGSPVLAPSALQGDVQIQTQGSVQSQ